jgi:uncharacterized protein (TIGR02145 family)
MKTKILQFVVVFCFLVSLPIKTVALNYTITFTGTGASTSIDSVIVQNLTKGTKVTVPSGNRLNLSDAPNALEQVSATVETIRVYPASVSGKSMVSFFARQAGVTQLSAFSLDGRKVAGISIDLQAGSNTFELSLPRGVFVIRVTGNEYAYTAKLLNSSGTQGNPGIVYIGTDKPASSGLQKVKSSGSTSLQYAAGDQLLYKGISGNYSTIVTDVPTGSKTTNINFVACMDTDGNNYTVVTIGTQTWMAENLKTTRYNDGTAIPYVTDNTAWVALSTSSTPAYCWYNNDATTYKNKYGSLYNWYAVNTGKLAPVDWHVPTDAEWTTLTDYVTANLDTFLNVAKALAATTDWTTYSTTGTIGCNLTLNNSTGFSAIPGGYRTDFGTYGSVGNIGYWWSYADYRTYSAWNRFMEYNLSNVVRYDGNMQGGFSVRCVRDSQ